MGCAPPLVRTSSDRRQGGFALTVDRFGDRRRYGSTSPAALACVGVPLRSDEVGRGHTFGDWGICYSGGRAKEPCGTRRGRIACGHSWHDVGRRHADGEDVETADFELDCTALYFSPHLTMVCTKRRCRLRPRFVRHKHLTFFCNTTLPYLSLVREDTYGKVGTLAHYHLQSLL